MDVVITGAGCSADIVCSNHYSGSMSRGEGAETGCEDLILDLSEILE